jgi:hypothetical protein
MKFIFFFALIIIPFIVVADPITKRDWHPIIGFNPNLNVSGYYDRNSIIVNKEENKIYTHGTVLLIAKSQIIIKVNGKEISTKSMMQNYVVECNTGLSIEYSDVFYNITTPDDTSRPVWHIERGADDVMVISKDSMLYRLLCPEYI